MSGTLQDIQKSQQTLAQIQEKEERLVQQLAAVGKMCHDRRWLMDGKAEQAAAELCQLVAEQKKLLDQNKLLLAGVPDLDRAAEVLAKELERQQASQRDQQIVRRFCALKTEDENLSALLPQRKTYLQKLVQEDTPEKQQWLDACQLLLEQIGTPDIARCQDVLRSFSDTLGAEFFAGLYSGKLTLPEGVEELPPNLPAPKIVSAPMAVPAPAPVTEKPAPQPEQAPKVPEEPTRPEADPDLSFEGPKRKQEPSSKQIGTLLKKGLIRGILNCLSNYSVLSEEMMFHQATEQAAPLDSLVRDGYVTKIIRKGEEAFYQVSPKLSAGLKKQSLQSILRGYDLQNIPRPIPEEEFTCEMLEHVHMTQRAMIMLYDDKRLRSWNATVDAIHWEVGRYQLQMRFDFTQRRTAETIRRRVVSLKGLDTPEDIRILLSAPDMVWAVTPREEDIPRWMDRLKNWELPMPEWMALDAPGNYFLSDGTRKDLTELFPPKLAEDQEEPPAPVEKEEKTEAQPAPEPAPTPQSRPEPKEEPGPAPKEEYKPETEEPKQEAAPTRPRSDLFDLGKPSMDFQEQAAQWTVAEKFPLALCLLHSAVEYDPSLAGIQKQLAYALNDPMENCEYLDNRLSDVYAAPCEGEWGGVFQDLRVSAYLRMSLSSAVSQNYFQTADSLQGFAGDDVLPSLRKAFRLLSQFIREQRRGMDKQIIRQIRHQGDVSTRLDMLAKEAVETRGRKWNGINAKMERIKDLFDLLLGSQSELMERLKIIADKDVTRREEVLSFCEKNQLLNAGGEPDQNGISGYIDRSWQSIPAKHSKNSPLTGTARNQAMNRISTCVNLCAQWLEQTGGGTLKDDKEVDRQHHQLIDYLSQARLELEDQKTGASTIYEQGAKAVLGETIQELLDLLQGNASVREFFYAEFLRTGYIELDAGFRPVLEQVKYMIPGYEPWERLRLHDQAIMKGSGGSWDAAVDRILGSDEHQPDFRNFGSALLIQRFCEFQGDSLSRLSDARLEEDDRKTLTKVTDMENRFRAELELAAAYGQIEDNTHKERLVTAITKQQREHFDESRNWGGYFTMMRACLEAVRKNAERLEPRYRYEFDQLKQTTPPCPVFEDIERLLNDKMFSVAHDYMQLVRSEHITQAPEGNMLQQPKEEDNLLRFLSAYSTLQRRSAERSDKESLYSLFKSLNSGEAGEDAEKLLRAWPQNGQADPEQMKALFQALAFPAARVEARRGGLFRVEMKASTANVFNYSHPIAAYGTELFPASERDRNSGLDVYILNGKKTVEELELKINALGLDSRPTIFLLNYSIPLADRRELARKLKQGSAHPSVSIVVDRVLMLFLARYPQAERARVLLQCTMPFHAYNPYTEGNIAPEMFMGRDTQLVEILRNGQANIIYGGRQLGKTALLRRAASLVDDRTKGCWAIYTDKMCRLDYEEALDEVYKCLWQSEFLERTEPPQDWAELCDRIQERMDRPGSPVKRFLLLLDEADRFLETSSELRYRPVECLYQLETATNERFKFVLAGLHSVMRFSREGTKGNSVLGKLSSRTIKPLTFPEASQLLELPLYYLGFRMKPEQNVLLSQILLSTNYYPGLIQFYCRQLVDSLKTRRAGEDPMPPYQLDEGTIRNLLQKEDFVEQIRNKFFITLDVEEDKLYYRALAYALAYCYYDSSEDSVEGYTFEQIQEVYEGFEIHSLCELEPKSVKILLSEMEELNVLMQMDGRYSFNGANFRHMMGDEETIMTELDKLNQTGGERK